MWFGFGHRTVALVGFSRLHFTYIPKYSHPNRPLSGFCSGKEIETSPSSIILLGCEGSLFSQAITVKQLAVHTKHNHICESFKSFSQTMPKLSPMHTVSWELTHIFCNTLRYLNEKQQSVESGIPLAADTLRRLHCQSRNINKEISAACASEKLMLPLPTPAGPDAFLLLRTSW